MYFNKWQALHGSYQLANDNISHGCVRMSVSDAKWLRTNFVRIGTLVVVLPY
jgi:lipoprotein-anchoring transpeptidase ErfK/SrfK